MPFYRSVAKQGSSPTPVIDNSYFVTINNEQFSPCIDFYDEKFEGSTANSQKFESVVIGNNVTHLGYMFSGYFTNNSLSYTGNVYFAPNSSLESGCYAFSSSALNFPQEIIVLPKLNKCSHMFYDCRFFNSKIVMQGAGNYMLNADFMFWRCGNYNQDFTFNNRLSGISMFQNCKNLNSLISIGRIDVGINMFHTCVNYNQPFTLNVKALATQLGASGVNCSGMFYGCGNLNSPITINVSGSENAVKLGEFNNMFSQCSAFNSVVNLVTTENIDKTKMLMNCDNMFRDCTNFNQPVSLCVNTGTSMFSGCSKLNKSVDFSDSCSVVNYAFTNCVSYNQDTTLKGSVNFAYKCFLGCTAFGKNVYIKSRNTSFHAGGMFTNCNNALRKNIWFNSVLNGRFNWTNVNSLAGATITWTDMTDKHGFYNTAYNIYCYNNYAG